MQGATPCKGLRSHRNQLVGSFKGKNLNFRKGRLYEIDSIHKMIKQGQKMDVDFPLEYSDEMRLNGKKTYWKPDFVDNNGVIYEFKNYKNKLGLSKNMRNQIDKSLMAMEKFGLKELRIQISSGKVTKPLYDYVGQINSQFGEGTIQLVDSFDRPIAL